MGGQKVKTLLNILYEGIHAREWISPATVTYIIRDLVTNQRHDNMLDQYDFFILPVVNPDGYEYTHTTDRLWRKNRAGNPLTLGLCRGVDLNRNFGYKWAEDVRDIQFMSTILIENFS